MSTNRGFEVDCPSNAETLLTGLVLVGRKNIRGVEWRCEIRRSGVQMVRDDKPVAWEQTNAAARKFAHQFVNWWKASKQLVTA